MERHYRGACVFAATDTVKQEPAISSVFGTISRPAESMSVINTYFTPLRFGGGCYTDTVTGTDASSESISMIKEERRNQKADGGCSYSYCATCWHS